MLENSVSRCKTEVVQPRKQDQKFVNLATIIPGRKLPKDQGEMAAPSPLLLICLERYNYGPKTFLVFFQKGMGHS